MIPPIVRLTDTAFTIGDTFIDLVALETELQLKGNGMAVHDAWLFLNGIKWRYREFLHTKEADPAALLHCYTQLLRRMQRG